MAVSARGAATPRSAKVPASLTPAVCLRLWVAITVRGVALSICDWSCLFFQEVDDRHWAACILRTMPHLDRSTDDWFYDFVEACSKDPYNRAVLWYLLPNYEEVLGKYNYKLTSILRVSKVNGLSGHDCRKSTD